MVEFNKLRLSGFKSFVDATELVIEPGLTGVVGPNGCGKSNLVEALRWVMGETSAKQMRGGEMDEVIFGGTRDRPARNIAEVSLILGNTAEYVIGKGTQESARILHGLRDHATSEPYHYAHEWELGDAVMWDNTGTLHRAMPYDPDCGRMLHRTIFKGDTWG